MNSFTIEVVKNQQHNFDVFIHCNGEIILEYQNISRTKAVSVLNKIKVDENEVRYSYRNYRTREKFFSKQEFMEKSSLFFDKSIYYKNKEDLK